MLNRRRISSLLPLLLLAVAATSCKSGDPAPIKIAKNGESATTEKTPDAEPSYTEISMKSQDQRVPVIMYHDVIKERNRHSVWFDCTTDELEKQMQQLQAWGATPISLDQLYAHLTSGAPIPTTAVVLTFDDNYQGFYDRALPILHKYNYPAAVFVHTGFVGHKEGFHPHMDWGELKKLVQDPLITIGNHTISHPADITKLDPADQRHEIVDAKADLEQHLGKKIDYFAYPDGCNDAATQQLVRASGHKMAFTIANGPAEESPNVVAINRYVHTRLQKAWDDRHESLTGGALGIYRGNITQAPVKYAEVENEGVRVGLVTGGTPVSMMSMTREGVLDFIRRAPGAVAGINGGFFAMAAISSTDNQMVGPCKTADMPDVVADHETFRWAKLRNRPLVLWGRTQFAIVPFVADSMADPSAFKDFMPDMTDTFLAGVWLVRNGVAREKDDMNTFSSKDIQDPRKRAFMGVMSDGRFVIGASLESVSSENLAKAIATAGVQEAVLLDSGFSTSLVYGSSIKAFGHSSPDNPSRPVPHAIVIKGDFDPETAAMGASDAPVTQAPNEVAKPKKKRRRRRRAAAPDGPPNAAGPPPDSAGPPPDTSTPPPDTTPPPNGSPPP